MIQQLLNHLERNKLCKTTDKILLAVSGGIDSMVMLDLFIKAGISVGVAHCNFQLRGQASESDEEFVQKRCGTTIPFYSVKFDTIPYADERKISIQMAARELRYNFFNQVMSNHGFHFLATAHHLNDSFETALLNFVRGTGVEGAGGIPDRNDRVIRPLLFATREMIRDYALANNVSWREDRSNESDDYQRNFLRNKITPLLKEINPNLEETFRNTSERLKGAAEITRIFIQRVMNNERMEEAVDLPRKVIHSTGSPATVLWEIIKDIGFNYDQAKEIVEEHQPGKIFESATFTITVDRDAYLLRKKGGVTPSEIHITTESAEVHNGMVKLTVQEVGNIGFKITPSASVAQLDRSKIQFPLKWRVWKSGDSFIPLGMRQHKKLSDFLIDLKIPLPEKQKVTVVESNGTIVWVVGFRIHDDFKITDSTTRVLILEQRS